MCLKKNLKLYALTAVMTLSLAVGLSALPNVGVNPAQAERSTPSGGFRRPQG